MIGGLEDVDEDHAKLLGAFFSHESPTPPRVMNPSMVPHPDQTGVRDGAVRFVMSLRTVGEGHISSVAFREGVAYPDGTFKLWPTASPLPPHRRRTMARAARSPSCAINLTTLSGTVIFPITRAQSNGIEDLSSHAVH